MLRIEKDGRRRIYRGPDVENHWSSGKTMWATQLTQDDNVDPLPLFTILYTNNKERKKRYINRQEEEKKHDG